MEHYSIALHPICSLLIPNVSIGKKAFCAEADPAEVFGGGVAAARRTVSTGTDLIGGGV